MDGWFFSDLMQSIADRGRAMIGRGRGNISGHKDLLRLAEETGLSQFPLGQIRPVLRVALGTGITDGGSPDLGFDAAYARASQVPGRSGGGSHVLPANSLARIAATLSEELDDILILGFPQGPFVLVLQADDTNAFKRFLRDSLSSEIEVDIRYAPGREKAGEWAIVPREDRDDWVIRFGIPPLLDSWLLAADAVELERAALAKEVLFSTIVIFRDGNRAVQLRYRKVIRPESTGDDVLTDPMALLRRALAAPELSFGGRQEADDDLLAPDINPDAAFEMEDDESPLRVEWELTEPPEADKPMWTTAGLTELLDRLDHERPVQAQVIRAAAQQPDGRLPRALVYELAEYEADRTLRGFTRPANRITWQLQREGLVPRALHPPSRRATRTEFMPLTSRSHPMSETCSPSRRRRLRRIT